MAHIPLSTHDKNIIIASQLIQGVSHTEILKKIRQSVETNFERIHLTTKHDIHNIMQSYNLHDSAIKHQNDPQSVDLWVNEEDFLLALMTKCQAAVKEAVGTIRAASFMSDDAEQYFAAWSSVMVTVETKKLLCISHVDRAWRSKVIAIKDKSKQAQIYKMLCTLRQEPDSTNYFDYFEKQYVPRCVVWAACFRVGTGVNTNMYLESMHKVLKYIYLKGVTCRRVDKTIHVLLQYVKDKQFERIIKLEKSKVTTKVSRINKSHIKEVNSIDRWFLRLKTGGL